MTTIDRPQTRTKNRRPMPQRSPDPKDWDHSTRCASFVVTTRRRDDLRSSNPSTVGDRRVRFRVRRCPACFRFYVERELRRPGS